MAYYYPLGQPGPVCDPLPTAQELDGGGCSSNADCPPGYICVNGQCVPSDGDGDWETIWEVPDGLYDPVKDIFDPIPPYLIGERCKVRTLSDGTKEYYDCEWMYLNDPDKLSDEEWPEGDTFPIEEIGFDDNFFIPPMDPNACNPFDPDINIRDIQFYNSDGTLVTKKKSEKSSPVTYNVTSDTSEVETSSGTLTAAFATDGNSLVISGTGTGNLLLQLSWADNPGTAGVAVDKISIGGQEFIRGDGAGGGSYSGNQTEGFQVTPGTYPITYTNLNSANSPIVLNSSQELCLKDGHGSDCNARFTIQSLNSQQTITNQGLWNAEGNKYGVWVNPQVCTLPEIPQTVTYQIPIPANDTYGFTFACDDDGALFIEDEETAFISATGGLFATGSNTTPYTGTRSLTTGTLKLTVNCTNSDGGYEDSNGSPTGLAYNWQRNPGGWYIKICRGGVCSGDSSINWVRSGPHPAWPQFMDDYAVYPSNTNTLSGVNHAANYIATCPNSGTYTLECRADNWAQFVWDGTTLGSIGQNVAPFNASFTTSTTYNITGVTVGDHTLGVTVLNGTGNTSWTNNPGGVAFVLRDGANNVIMTSLDLDNAGDGNLIWHSRMGTGYKYETT